MAPTSTDLIELLAGRRSYYALSASSPISDSKVQEIVSDILLKTPSAFNSQTTRIVLLLKDAHQRLWDIVSEILRTKMGEARWASAPTAAKINSFRSAYGTAMFFEDQAIIRDMQENFKSYKDHFPEWSHHTAGMHQIALWTALESEGFGANLQHYNPVINDKVREAWSLPEDWLLNAQLVFGKRESDTPAPKDKKPLSETFKVFGA